MAQPAGPLEGPFAGPLVEPSFVGPFVGPRDLPCSLLLAVVAARVQALGLVDLCPGLVVDPFVCWGLVPLKY